MYGRRGNTNRKYQHYGGGIVQKLQCGMELSLTVLSSTNPNVIREVFDNCIWNQTDKHMQVRNDHITQWKILGTTQLKAACRFYNFPDDGRMHSHQRPRLRQIDQRNCRREDLILLVHLTHMDSSLVPRDD